MKNLVLISICLFVALACKKDAPVPVEEEEENYYTGGNDVVLLKVDYQSYAFEGGKEFDFESSSNFTISTTYQSPGDFGSVQLYYDELDELIFDGTIVWAGLGSMSYPAEMEPNNNFTILDNELALPNMNEFEHVMYSEFEQEPTSAEKTSIWNAINELSIVEEYRNSNPQGKIHTFLYTPSVGVGDPADWDWFVILKN